jgi:hypothetical protein
MARQRIAHDLVGDTRTVKGFDQGAALRTQTIEDGEIAKSAVARCCASHTTRIEREIAGATNGLLDAMHQIFGFGAVGGGGVDL